jgi:polyferredoxin
MSDGFYILLADGVLGLHMAVVLFVVGGWLSVIVGHRWPQLQWQWIAHRGFRLTHLLAIGFIAAQAWLGRYCPLTVLESWLRAQAGEAGYTQSFVQHWLHKALYFDAPLWVFALAYTVFGLLVLLTWWRIPPRRLTRE